MSFTHIPVNIYREESISGRGTLYKNIYELEKEEDMHYKNKKSEVVGA